MTKFPNRVWRPTRKVNDVWLWASQEPTAEDIQRRKEYVEKMNLRMQERREPGERHDR